jgi:tetrahydromethanopterin S-methyltransferase subunit G
VLRILASQEDCDEEPYPQMKEAANYINELEARIEELEKKLIDSTIL